MSEPETQMSAINKKDKIDSKLHKFEHDIKENLSVSCRDNFNEYLFNSTLHGLRYVGDRTITRVERGFFACMFFLVVLLSIYFISNVYLKYTASPIIITLSSKSTSVKDMPFPAVTICNMNTVKKSAIEKYPKDSIEYYVSKSLCRNDFSTGNDTHSKKGTWQIFRKMLLEVSPSCESMLLYCEYGGLKFNCTKKFSKILTDDGLCCVFNNIHRKFLIKTEYVPSDEVDGNERQHDESSKWTPEKGYPGHWKTRKQKYPRPGVGSGNELGLTLILNGDIHDYFCSSTKSYGFKIFLHAPNDLPRVAHYGVAVPNGYESRIVIMPTRSEASDAVRKINKNIRQCIFENENPLSYYSSYSKRNCESECETKLLYEYCHCIMYYQPREHKNISICGAADMECTVNVDREIQTNSKENSSFRCDHCFSGCYAITYDSTFSTAKIFDQVPFLRQNKLDAKNVAILHIYYSQSSFRSQIKDELVGFTDFLSNIGGLLGLLMGFSVISVIELFYFVSIRPYCNYIRFANQRRKIIARVLQKIDSLRRRKNSPITVITVAASPSLDINYPHTYVD